MRPITEMPDFSGIRPRSSAIPGICSCGVEYPGMILERRAQRLIQSALSRAPAVVLLGSRQVGKTTLARSLLDARSDRSLYLDLERTADARRLEDAGAFLASRTESLIAIDEVQRKPGLFPDLRAIIDDGRRVGYRTGRFLLLGLASLDLLKQSSESLAGRVTYIELEPLDVIEAGPIASPDVLWFRGGFPESVLASDDAASFAWRRDFIRTYLERDVPMFGPRLPAEAIGRLWTMLAHAQGTMLNVSSLARNLGVSTTAIERYLGLLVDLFLVRRLPPWAGNVAKRLVRSPKIYLRDSGIAHALLEIEDAHALSGHPIYGASFEAFVIENLLTADRGRHAASYFRTEGRCGSRSRARTRRSRRDRRRDQAFECADADARLSLGARISCAETIVCRVCGGRPLANRTRR